MPPDDDDHGRGILILGTFEHGPVLDEPRHDVPDRFRPNPRKLLRHRLGNVHDRLPAAGIADALQSINGPVGSSEPAFHVGLMVERVIDRADPNDRRYGQDRQPVEDDGDEPAERPGSGHEDTNGTGILGFGYTGPMIHRIGLLLALVAVQDDPLKTPWGRLELKENAVYLFIDAWPADGKVAMPRLNNPIGAVYLVNDPARKGLGFQPNLNDWSVSRPKNANDGPETVVVEVLGKPRIAGAPVVVAPADDDSITLAAHDAVTHGRLLRYEPQPHKNTVGYWADETDWCEWKFRGGKRGSYKVILLQGCGKGQGGSAVKVVVAGQTLDYIVEDTGHFQNFVERPAGTIVLDKPGDFTLELRAAKKAKGAVMDVRQVRLVPE